MTRDKGCSTRNRSLEYSMIHSILQKVVWPLLVVTIASLSGCETPSEPQRTNHLDGMGLRVTWERVHSSSGTSPTDNGLNGFIYDSVRGRMIAVDSPNLWALDQENSSWERLNTGQGSDPERRHFSAVIYDPVGDRVVVHGGARPDGGGSLNDTWSFDLSTNEWLSHATPGIELEYGLMAIYDSARSRMVVVGTKSQDSALRVWALDLSDITWTQLHTGSGIAPPERTNSLVAYDQVTDELILFAGHPYDPRTWAFDLDTLTWRILHDGEGKVPEDYYYNGGIDAGRRWLIGHHGYVKEFEVWAFDLATKTWFLLHNGKVEEIGWRGFSGGAYDPISDSLLLYGGIDYGRFYMDDITYKYDTWAFRL